MPQRFKIISANVFNAYLQAGLIDLTELSSPSGKQ
jgi:hypothetical protein